MTTCLRRWLICLSIFLGAIATLDAQEKSVRPGINQPFEKPDVPQFIERFEREGRDIYDRRHEIVQACGIKPGMAVADIGAGTGLFSRMFSPLVGKTGKVYAVDIAEDFIKHIERTAKEQKLDNIVGVVCKADSASLPPASIDLAFICDTYHHFEFPEKTMRSIHAALRPGGQVILIDFHRLEGKSRPWVLDHVRAGQEVFTKEIEACGFRQVEEKPELLVESYFVRFAKVDEPASAATKTFTYKKTNQGQLDLIVHFPRRESLKDRRPAIVFFFGGGWTSGTVNQFEPQAEYLASRGMVAVRADYRVKSRHGVKPDACVEDAKSAIRWMRQHAGELGVDPERIVAAGGSAGGHIAACTALAEGLEAAGEDAGVSSRPNALVLFNPVLDMTAPQLLARLEGDEKLARQISPTLHLTRSSPPALLLYGTADRLMAQGEAFVKRSKEIGHRAELYTADGQGHGFFNCSPWRERTTVRMDEFLGSLGYLEGKPTLEAP
jgi:acetyl esterase/lipase